MDFSMEDFLNYILFPICLITCVFLNAIILICLFQKKVKLNQPYIIHSVICEVLTVSSHNVLHGIGVYGIVEFYCGSVDDTDDDSVNMLITWLLVAAYDFRIIMTFLMGLLRIYVIYRPATKFNNEEMHKYLFLSWVTVLMIRFNIIIDANVPQIDYVLDITMTMGIYKLWKVKHKANQAVSKFEFVVNNIRRDRGGQNRILTRAEKLRKRLSKFYPPWKETKGNGIYDRMFVEGTNEHSIGILVRNIMMIEVFGIVMYLLMSFKYSMYPEVIGTTISVIIHIFLMFTLFFPKLMSYFMISVHVMLATKVKNILLILIIAMAFEGPAMNIIHNMHHVASGVACVQTDVMGSRDDLESNMMNKGQQFVEKMRVLMINIAQPMNSAKKMLYQLDQKTAKYTDFMRQTFASIVELSNQCKNMLETPYIMCHNQFDKSYYLCKQGIRFFGANAAVCDIIMHAQSICEVIPEQADFICSIPRLIARGTKAASITFTKLYFKSWEMLLSKVLFFYIEMGKQAYQRIKPVLQEMKKAKNMKISYVNGKRGKTDTSEDSTANIRKSIQRNLMKLVNFYVGIIKGISYLLRYAVMPMLLIWPFIYTLRFIYSYNYNDTYKNAFLTEEFMKVDQDCIFRKVRRCLPLTTDESNVYIHRSAWKMTEKEEPIFHLDIFITIITCFAPLFLCIVDFGVYKVLSAVNLLMNMTTVDNPAHYELKVAGNGFMANILNEMLDVFSPFTGNVRERESRWKQCFKQPDPPNYFETFVMFLMFCTAMFLCRLKAYLGRQTLALADYFFPNRVRVRALSLYNKILQNRKSLLAEMMGILKSDGLGGEEAIVRQSVQSRGHLCSDCVKCEKYDIRITDQENVRICIHCGAFYCIDCFSFTRDCIKCDMDMQIINGVELFYEDDSDFEEELPSGEEEEDDESTDKDKETEKESKNQTTDKETDKISDTERNSNLMTF